jgi:hypothetical protein
MLAGMMAIKPQLAGRCSVELYPGAAGKVGPIGPPATVGAVVADLVPQTGSADAKLGTRREPDGDVYGPAVNVDELDRHAMRPAFGPGHRKRNLT